MLYLAELNTTPVQLQGAWYSHARTFCEGKVRHLPVGAIYILVCCFKVVYEVISCCRPRTLHHMKLLGVISSTQCIEVYPDWVPTQRIEVYPEWISMQRIEVYPDWVSTRRIEVYPDWKSATMIRCIPHWQVSQLLVIDIAASDHGSSYIYQWCICTVISHVSRSHTERASRSYTRHITSREIPPRTHFLHAMWFRFETNQNLCILRFVIGILKETLLTDKSA